MYKQLFYVQYYMKTMTRSMTGHQHSVQMYFEVIHFSGTGGDLSLTLCHIIRITMSDTRGTKCFNTNPCFIYMHML